MQSMQCCGHTEDSVVLRYISNLEKQNIVMKPELVLPEDTFGDAVCSTG